MLEFLLDGRMERASVRLGKDSRRCRASLDDTRYERSQELNGDKVSGVPAERFQPGGGGAALCPPEKDVLECWPRARQWDLVWDRVAADILVTTGAHGSRVGRHPPWQGGCPSKEAT